MDGIISIIGTIISLGQEINTRFEKRGEAIGELKKLERILVQLKSVLEKINKEPDKANKADKDEVENVYIIGIKDTLVKAQDTYLKCAKDLGINEDTGKSKFKFIKQGIGILKSPSILENIQAIIKEIEVELSLTEKFLSIVQHTQTLTTTETTTSTSSLGSELKGALANTIEEIVKRLQNDCQQLKERLDRCTLPVDSSFLDVLGRDNPEAIAFWKQRFRSAELSIASIIPYENIYVSWARFVHEIETAFQLKNIPTAIMTFNESDEIRKNGSRYLIKSNGTLDLKNTRPLWLPALREALDPLHKGYVKPHDYLSFLGEEQLSSKLRQVVLNSCGYGFFVECRKTSSDIPLPTELECPAHSVGWMSACQIVSVPSLDELGIFLQNESNLDSIIKHIIEYPDIRVYVRYLQTGQIEKKLLTDIRILGGLRIGISISIRYTLENNSKVWSSDFSVIELKACSGGRYIVTARSDAKTIVFVTMPPVGFGHFAIQTDQHEDLKDLPELEYSLLGPSTVFRQKPKDGEKIQVNVDGLWHDVKVTKVDDKDVEYVNWSSADVIPVEDTENIDDLEDVIGFSEQNFTELERGEKRSWCPWKDDNDEGVTKWDIRPYRCLHVGDLVEAPVVYPDYKYRYHSLEDSQLYLPARIIEVEGDQYLVEFSPAFIAYKWWPGRSSNPDKFPREPEAKETVKNPFFNKTQVWVNMDRVRPCGADPHPVLSISSMRPHSWSVFQGIQFTDLQQLSEKILWRQ
ncbi:12138_t:CDS:2 [Racocetra persica]|uniref:12138_t:CDS:1 n=1 Tax=Racocetra persica TaxID=160502 RepID=A0ACA9LSP5_9GLOM|nr:12138_t:CDS:2 [Racocetra persica]